MAKLYFRPSFHKDLAALKTHNRTNYKKVCEILIELQSGAQTSVSRRAESRIPKALKYELADGYRIVFQQVEESDELIALTVGKHEHVDSFLDGHRGWVFDPSTGRMRELRLATLDDTSIDTVPSKDLLTTPPAPPSQTPPPPSLFQELTDSMVQSLGVPEHLIPSLRAISDPNSMDLMAVLERVSDRDKLAADYLLAYATGNPETRQSILGIASRTQQHLQTIRAAHVPAIQDASDEFVSFDDATELEEVLEKGTFEQWQLFLHPMQKQLVTRTFNGPARIRGISGSGKTVVALHRARHLAKQLRSVSTTGSDDATRILFTTFNKALVQSAGRLLDSLCSQERRLIEVVHLHKWCLDYIAFRGLRRPTYSRETLNEAQERTLQSFPATVRETARNLGTEYVWDEVRFLMGRFLHEERREYLRTDRTGRGRALTPEQREVILEIYERYMETLTSLGCVDPAEFERIAFRLRMKNEAPRYSYAAVIVDEVQDMSEIALRLLHSLVGDLPNGLLLVGDGTQRIFTRGYSMRGLGIDVAGRSVVLRKNYRNTRQILEAAFPLIAQQWEEEVGGEAISAEVRRPELSMRDGVRPIIVMCRTPRDEARFIEREIRYLLRYDKYRPRDVCVMARNRFYRDLVFEVLNAGSVPVQHYQTETVWDDPVEQDRVRISSLHSAKGHEYAAVFLAGMVEGVFPHPQASLDDEVAAERTLLYVGMTRARDIVYLSQSEVRDDGRSSARSRFLEEISAQCDTFAFRW